MKAFLICVILIFPFTLFAQTADTTYYSVVANGFITGAQKSWKQGNNEYRYIFYFNDRGRGSNVKEKIITNSDGLVISAETSGVDYTKSAYQANFSVVNDSAVWTTNGVRKTRKNNNEVYTQYMSPGPQEILWKWMIKQPGRKMYVLPEDSMRMNEPIVRKITFNKKTLTLKLCAVFSDQNPFPSYTWMTGNMNFFADVGGWGGTIMKGYEEWIDTLTSIQETEAAPIFTAQLKENSTSVKNHLLIDHAALFNSADASVKSNMSVEVISGKIHSIFPSDKKVAIHADTVIDAKGKFLMPGLWDMHGHYNKTEGVWYLAGGVTHVRDMGNISLVATWQQQIRKNLLLGPDLSYLSGFIDRQDSLQGPAGKIVPSLEKALEAIDYYHNKGYNQIKIYSSIKPEWVKPMADRAHALGMPVAGHVPAYMNAEQAINAGYNEITHNNMIFLNFMGADTLATNGILPLRLPALMSGTIDLQSDRVKSFINLMKTKSISHDPTLHIQEGMYTEFIGDTSKTYKPIISWMPASLQKDLTITSSMGTNEQKPAYLASFENSKKMVKLLFDNGILLVAGTDGGEAIALHRELEIYCEAGIPPNEVLKIATYNAAKDCRLENRYGQIRIGTEADFILIDGDPTKNISDVRRVEWVIKNGRMYSPKKLYASQGWKYYH